MMTEKRRIAIQNNLNLYEAILRSHQLKSFQTDDIWYCLDQIPPLYSNLITKRETWSPDSIFDAIDQVYKTRQWPEWSVKDSFGSLDLLRYGFQKLFNAQWMYLPSNTFRRDSDPHIQFKIMKDEDGLSKWIKAWETGEARSIGNRIFSSALLLDPNVYFITAYRETQIAGGCLINKTGNVWGISNGFGPEGDIQYWSALISFVFENIEPLDIVGYWRDAVFRIFLSLGFEPVGTLSVWLKENRQPKT